MYKCYKTHLHNGPIERDEMNERASNKISSSIYLFEWSEHDIENEEKQEIEEIKYKMPIKEEEAPLSRIVCSFLACC